jgi:hypothetical protein
MTRVITNEKNKPVSLSPGGLLIPVVLYGSESFRFGDDGSLFGLQSTSEDEQQ